MDHVSAVLELTEAVRFVWDHSPAVRNEWFAEGPEEEGPGEVVVAQSREAHILEGAVAAAVAAAVVQAALHMCYRPGAVRKMSVLAAVIGDLS